MLDDELQATSTVPRAQVAFLHRSDTIRPLPSGKRLRGADHERSCRKEEGGTPPPEYRAKLRSI